ncbi:hypothetical protein [Neorhizobium sp. T6_25]|uniref:hypothetical protein n=1 Tax=Neorhizobium sp. T6_25 TaxID=2093833 RepID=UPI000CF95E47|nr:hypothetical protein [Neorhizobium sp. T6_25]
MRFSVLVISVLTATSAQAACNGDLIAVQDWNIRPLDATTNELTYTVKSNAPKAIRMIDGQVGFKDALGKSIGPLAIERDAVLTVGGTFTETRRWGPHTFERLLKLKKDEVTPYTCVKAVLYEDGSKEEFK